MCPSQVTATLSGNAFWLFVTCGLIGPLHDWGHHRVLNWRVVEKVSSLRKPKDEKWVQVRVHFTMKPSESQWEGNNIPSAVVE
jgi:hypothetical protein